MVKDAAVPEVDDNGEVVIKPTIVQVQANLVASQQTFIRFRKRAMVQVDTGFPHFEPLSMERFKELFYPMIPGQTRSRVGDVYEQLTFAAPDLTDMDHLILFGRYDIPEGAEKPDNHADSVGPMVWDTRELAESSHSPTSCVWRSPYAKISNMVLTPDGPVTTKIPFILSLAGGDPEVYDDIMQSMAPMVMEKKPDGVIWWIGDGANGKSTLMDALYRLFPQQLSSITVKRLTDGRDTPNLNGTLANIVKESSEGRIDDTEIYKSIGTHEDFGVHKFHSQEGVTIRGNLHHIFSGNSVPIFNDKGFSARRRTFIIPFTEQFASDPEFEDKTFTPEFFGRLATELCKYAVRLKRQGYRYKFSAKTLAAKEEYDSSANSAEEYVQSIIRDGVVAFDNFQVVQVDYENWCAENGFVALGRNNMKRAVMVLGFERVTYRTKEGTSKHWRLPDFRSRELQQLGGFRLGLYTVPGFEPAEEDAVAPVVPEFKEPQTPRKTGW